jgi:hypothetical protein
MILDDLAPAFSGTAFTSAHAMRLATNIIAQNDVLGQAHRWRQVTAHITN